MSALLNAIEGVERDFRIRDHLAGLLPLIPGEHFEDMRELGVVPKEAPSSIPVALDTPPGDVIARREFSIGPEGFFGHGAGQGATTITIEMCRPVKRDDRYECECAFRVGLDVVHRAKVSGVDGVAAFSGAARAVVADLETRFFREWDAVVPREYFDDMRGVEMTQWAAEEKVIWVFPDGARRRGRIAVGVPKYESGDSGTARCPYALDGLERVRGPMFGEGTLQAMAHAYQMIGLRLYWRFCDGVRLLYFQPDEEAEAKEDPQGDTARLIGMLGSLVRDHGNSRGPADPEGRLADLEKLREEQMHKFAEECRQEDEDESSGGEP
ncbi:MAG TPA: hypothetical protein VN253_11160 [Kofleriaceae bacterium]|nr:hypothetical protein [Kofleriaceae bacterium]